MLAKPQTYMNLSGDRLSASGEFYKLIRMEDLIVVFDDISLAPWQLDPEKEVRADTTQVSRYYRKTGTDQFARVKVGVGKTAGLGSGRSCAGTFFAGGQRKI